MSVPGKVMEQIPLTAIVKHAKDKKIGSCDTFQVYQVTALILMYALV